MTFGKHMQFLFNEILQGMYNFDQEMSNVMTF